jgi:hypothetical protein
MSVLPCAFSTMWLALLLVLLAHVTTIHGKEDNTNRLGQDRDGRILAPPKPPPPSAPPASVICPNYKSNSSPTRQPSTYCSTAYTGGYTTVQIAPSVVPQHGAYCCTASPNTCTGSYPIPLIDLTCTAPIP